MNFKNFEFHTFRNLISSTLPCMPQVVVERSASGNSLSHWVISIVGVCVCWSLGLIGGTGAAAIPKSISSSNN
jgi:L-cystine uptake protein TcyP (sodium:dicarboxylate symporter family)